MKQISYLLFALVLIACSEQKKQVNEEITNQETATQLPEPLPQFDWLVGNWLRQNDAEGKTTYEQWTKKSETEYVGKGFTLANEDTVFSEDLRVILDNEEWKLEVTGVNESPTYFVFNQYTASSFSCVNPENEFPKQIDYQGHIDSLVATISGDGNEMSFIFKPIME